MLSDGIGERVRNTRKKRGSMASPWGVKTDDNTTQYPGAPAVCELFLFDDDLVKSSVQCYVSLIRAKS